MSYKQNVTPSLDPFLYQDGHVLTSWSGWCLLYVQTAFGAGWAGSTAWEAWNDHVSYKHEDWNLPSGVYLPIWFSGYHNMGHVAIYKDGQVTSSPLSNKPNADTWGSIQEVEQRYGVTYVGWSEDIGGTRVIEPVPDAPAYTIEYVAAKQVKAHNGARKWNLGYSTFDEVSNNPVDTAGENTIVTVNGLLRHREIPQYQYYVEDINNPVGWNTLDVDEYTPPVYTPPAAPLVVPTSNDPYQLVTSVMGYPSANSAANDINGRVALAAGVYHIYSQKYGMINITKNPGRPGDLDNAQGGWINPAQNTIAPPPVPAPVVPEYVPSVGPRQSSETPVVAPPVVVAPTPKPAPVADTEAKIRSTYQPFNPTGLPIYCAVLKDVLVQDVIHLGEPFTLHRLDKDGLDREIPVYGTFKANGRYYAKIKLKNDVSDYYMYGIPLASPTTLLPYLDDTYDITDRILYGVESFIDKAHKSIDGIFRRFKKK